MKNWVQSQVTSSDIHGLLSGTGTGYSLEFFGFPPLIIITPPSLPHKECDIPDQAAHYHTLSPKLGASFLSLHLAGLRVKVVLFSLKFVEESLFQV